MTVFEDLANKALNDANFLKLLRTDPKKALADLHIADPTGQAEKDVRHVLGQLTDAHIESMKRLLTHTKHPAN